MPEISVITPVYNGEGTLDRAIRSVLAQTYADWELLLIDDGSTDSSAELIQSWMQKDSRIKVLQTAENGAQCVARHLGLQHSGGPMVCYLDQDDEFLPDYLETVDRWKQEGDVLFFHYELFYEDAPDRRIELWRPDRYFRNLFSFNISVPLGVAHHRKWFEQVGGYNELLWSNEVAGWHRQKVTECVPLDLPVPGGLT